MNNIIYSNGKQRILQHIAVVFTTILVISCFWYKTSLKSFPDFSNPSIPLIYICLLILTLLGVCLYQRSLPWRKKAYPAFISAPSLMLAAYALTATIITGLTSYFGENISRRGLDLQTILLGFAVYISIILFIETKNDLKNITLVWIAAGIIISLSGWHQIIFPQYEAGTLKNQYGQAFTKKIPPLPFLQKIFIKDTKYRKTSGLFEHPNIFSRTLIPFISISLFMLFTSNNKYKKLVLPIFFIIPFLLTINRAAFFAVLGGCILSFFILLLKKKFNSRTTNLYLYAFVALICFYIFFLYQRKALISETLSSQLSMSSRIEGSVIMRSIFAKHPERLLRGNGLVFWDEIYAEKIFIRKYQREYSEQLPQQNTYAYIQGNKQILYKFYNTSLRTTDNTYLNILLTDGILGFAFFLAFILISLSNTPAINTSCNFSTSAYAIAAVSLSMYYLVDAFSPGDLILLIIVFAFLNKSKQQNFA